MTKVYEVENPLFGISLISFPNQSQSDLNVWLAATRAVFAVQGEVPPAWCFFSEHAPSSVAQVLFTPKLDFNDSKVKATYAEIIRKFSMDFPSRSYCFASEAWLVKRSNSVEVIPSEEPDREEHVVVIYETRDETKFLHAIVTEEDGKRTLGEWEDMYPGNIGGRFASILNKKGSN